MTIRIRTMSTQDNVKRSSVSVCPTEISAYFRYVNGPPAAIISSSFAACEGQKWKTPVYRKPAQQQAPYPRLKRGILDVAKPRRLFFGPRLRASIDCARAMPTFAPMRSRRWTNITDALISAFESAAAGAEGDVQRFRRSLPRRS